MIKYIWVTFRKEGIHCYPEAPEEVSFLRSPHRHLFHFKVWVEVKHNNRDREFFIEKNWIESLYNGGILILSYKSCEMMADELYEKLKERYQGEGRKIKIEISEDGENGCWVEYD